MSMKITPLLRWVTAFEVGVLLVAGGGLFFVPDLLVSLWPWELRPFNTRLMGAVYLASMMSALTIVVYPYWSLARLVVPLILVFTGVVLGVSVVYLDHFDGPVAAVGLWFALYSIIPANAAWHLWRDWRQVLANRHAVQPGLRSWLYMQSLILGGYGVFVLIAPLAATTFWPWAMDAFQARVYSVAFITPGLGAYLLARFGGKRQLRVLGITQVVGGLLPMIGLIVVDVAVKRILWLDIQVWLWLGLFGYIALSGVVLLLASRTQHGHYPAAKAWQTAQRNSVGLT